MSSAIKKGCGAWPMKHLLTYTCTIMCLANRKERKKDDMVQEIRMVHFCFNLTCLGNVVFL
jgi:hypothetical protein